MKRFCAALVPALMLLGPTAVVNAQPDAGYKVIARYQPGGDGGWDYVSVDPAAQRLYVSRSTRAQVIDLATGKLVGEIPDTPGIHGIAVAPELNRGFTSNGRDSSVTVFDLKTLATLKRVHIPSRNPDAILYDPGTKRVFTFNGGSQNATAIDAVADTVVGEVFLGGKPEAGVIDGGRVFVNIEDSSAVVGFDARSLKVQSRWPLAPGEGPSGLAIDRGHHRLFSVCGNQKMIVLDSETGHIVTTQTIGSRVDGAAFDDGDGLAFSSNGEGTLTVVHEDAPDKFSLVANVETQRGARTIALDSKTHRIYLPTATYGETPAATPENPRPRPQMVPGSFTILVLDR
jgi:DNA-binding beta-propeller fold protein YncE